MPQKPPSRHAIKAAFFTRARQTISIMCLLDHAPPSSYMPIVRKCLLPTTPRQECKANVMMADQITRVIQSILAPVALVTTCALLINGLQQRYVNLGDRLRTFHNEWLMLHLNRSTSPNDTFVRWREDELAVELPHMQRRYRMIHDALVALYIATCIFLITMLLLALIDVALSDPVAPLALVGTFCGTLMLLVGAIIAVIEASRSDREVLFEMKSLPTIADEHEEKD